MKPSKQVQMRLCLKCGAKVSVHASRCSLCGKD